jgi:hypothetical protein
VIIVYSQLQFIVTRQPILPCILIAKQFEKQADRFVYQTMHNAEGLIEYCTYLQKQQDKIETDYANTHISLNSADISFIDAIGLLCSFGIARVGHGIYNAFKWIWLHTPLTPYQSNAARIKAAQEYLAAQQIK